MEWPRKFDLFGIQVSATDYEEAARLILAAAAAGESAVVTHLPVAGVVAGYQNPALRSMINSFAMVAPDGHPVRWSLNRLHHTGLTDRVYGPELMLRLCKGAAAAGIGVYLYGSYPQVVERLRDNLLGQSPGLRVVGCESPPFRPLTPEEDQQVVERINASGAGLIFLGLGCPRQDIFAYEHRHSLRGIQMCVGAAFDFHAGSKKMAPAWMQKRGLEWLFRFLQEPQRLWRRYFWTNSVFLLLLIKELLHKR